MNTNIRFPRWTALLIPVLMILAARAVYAYNWPQFNQNSQHSGNDTQESAIDLNNVANLKKLFRVSLPGVADGAPAYLSQVQTKDGIKNLLFVTTKNGYIVALDSLTGAQVWSHQYPAGTCRINNGALPCYTTSSPVAGPDHQYVYTYGLDGYVHKLRVGDGTEVKGGGWPELATKKPYNEKGSSDLSIATAQDGTSYLYVANGGYPGDRGDYQGHLTTINLSNGTQHVFNTLCSNQAVHFVETPGTPDCPYKQSAIWARAGVVYDPANNKIYMATGNGLYDPGLHDWGETVFALSPDGTGANGDPLDSYTPGTYQELTRQDADLGSTAPAILPGPSGSKYQNLAVQGGKDQLLRLINLDNLSGQGGPGHVGGEIGPVIQVPQGGQILTAPAVWVNPADNSTWVFVATSRGISGLKLVVNSSGTPRLQEEWQNSSGGTSPVVANGVLFYAGSGAIRALNPVTGTQAWSDSQISGIHWESPIVDNGVVYISDESGGLTAYSLNGTAPSLFNNRTCLPIVER